jgi:hypothetical protein
MSERSWDEIIDPKLRLQSPATQKIAKAGALRMRSWVVAANGFPTQEDRSLQAILVLQKVVQTVFKGPRRLLRYNNDEGYRRTVNGLVSKSFNEFWLITAFDSICAPSRRCVAS